MAEAKQPIDSTPEANLVRLEEAVCDFLAKYEAGELNPWRQRLGPGERDRVLLQLAKALGPRYWQCTLDNFEMYEPINQAPVLKRLREFAETMPVHLEAGGGILMFGMAGTGKDHLLAALLKIAVAKHGLSAIWFDGGHLFDELHIAATDEGLPKLRKRLTTPHILAISDPVPPKGTLTDAQLRRLRDIIDRRYRLGVSTWITTNLDSPSDAGRILSAPVLERIKESAGQVFCDWSSYRPRKKPTW